MKILCAGDLHIGRRPSRLPGIDCGPLSCATTWSAIVEKAIEEGVDLVALSGDVVDQANRYYEAIGPLEAGIRKLASRGIRTVAVAGNHDFDVLPALSESLPAEDFRLLGRGGRWERFTYTSDGRPVLYIDGWSFPQQRHTANPLLGQDTSQANAVRAVPVLGLLHADLDQPRSLYAPVRLTDLRSQAVDFWLLGHVHAPRHLKEGGAQVLYPGSPQAMDPGEQGVHGAWMVEIDSGGRFTATAVPLATVRYERVTVDLDGVADPLAIGPRVTEAVQRRLEECVEAGCGPLRYLSVRLALTGRTGIHGEIGDIRDRIVNDLKTEHAGVRAVVEQVELSTGPALDLESLARTGDATGLLARLVLALDRPTGTTPKGDGPVAEHERLVRAAAQAAADSRAAPAYSALPRHEVEMPLDDARRVLAEQAMVLLDALLAQKEAA